MASSNKTPGDVQSKQEGITDNMGRKIKVSHNLLVKMEIKGEKTENKRVALTPCRIFVLNYKIPSKLEHTFHFLDIQSLESKISSQLALTIDGKVYTFHSMDPNTGEIDHIITHIGVSLTKIFPAFSIESLIDKVDVQPPERLKAMQDTFLSQNSKGIGPCGGYTTMYQCMCDYHGQPFREEVEWDVDTIYLSLDSREFRLQDFDHLLPKDLVPIIAALKYNTYFKAINASNVKLSPDACQEIIGVMERNAVIEEINLSNTGIKSDFLKKFTRALSSNSETQLSSLDVSNNYLDDTGVQILVDTLKQLPCGLTKLDVSRTGITSKCLNKIGEALAQSPNSLLTLTTLSLNDTGYLFRNEDLPLLYNCLAQPNAITYLNLSYTDCALDTLCDPLLRGCPSLVTLKAARTFFTHKKSREVQVPRSWKQLFTSACCLERVDFSNSHLPPEALKELLLGVAANRNMKGLYLDVSGNNLGAAGALAIAPCMPALTGLHGFDLSDNGLDTELKSLLPEIAKNTHLRKLSIGRNFTFLKPKPKTEAMNAVAAMLQEDNFALEYLSLADSRLKGDLSYVINALGSNETLLDLDISGNGIGDIGARMLAKALLINSKLRKVVWDKNNVSTLGFEDVAVAVQRNMTLKKMPYPIHDASVAMRSLPERTEAALQKIESCLQRNHSPRRFAPEQAYRLQQGFLISSTQQMVDRLVMQVEESVNALQSLTALEPVSQELITASRLVADANSSRQLLPSLQDIAIKSQAAGNTVDSELQALADGLKTAIVNQMEKTTTEMLECTTTNCPAIMENQTFQTIIQEGCQSKSALPKEFASGLLETVGTDIYNTTSEMNLAVAALISDSVIDGVIESLSATHKSLRNHLNHKKNQQQQEEEAKEAKEKPEPEVGATLRVPEEAFAMSSSDNLKSPGSPKIANKRKSVLNRKTRPQSTMVGEASLAVTAPSAENSITNHVKEDSARNTPLGSTERLADFPDLPDSLPTSAKPLKHVTRERPQRPKAHRPTRPTIDPGSTEMDDIDVDVGTRMTQISSPAPGTSTSSSPKTSDKRDHKSGKDKQEESSSKPGKWRPFKKKDDKADKEAKESKKKEEKAEKESKKKEDKAVEKESKDAKKSNSFSSGFKGLFSKRPSEDKIRKQAGTAELLPSCPETRRDSDVTDSVPDTADKPGVPAADVVDGTDTHCQTSKELESSGEISKPVPKLAEIEINPPDEETATTVPGQTSEGPRAPPRPHSQNRQAMLPPTSPARLSDGTKSPEIVVSDVSAQEVASLQEDEQKKDSEPQKPEASSTEEIAEVKKEESPQEKEKEKKLPPGLAKMPGLGALGGKNLLLEMKTKQEKRFSQRPLSPGENHKEPPVFTKPASETNNNVQNAAAAVLKSPPVQAGSANTTTTTATTVTPPPKPVAPARPTSRTLRPASAETPPSGSEDVSATTSPSNRPVVPNPAPRPAMPASKRPVSVVEAPGPGTADIPSSMTTSTPEFSSEDSSDHIPPVQSTAPPSTTSTTTTSPATAVSPSPPAVAAQTTSTSAVSTTPLASSAASFETAAKSVEIPSDSKSLKPETSSVVSSVSKTDGHGRSSIKAKGNESETVKSPDIAQTRNEPAPKQVPQENPEKQTPAQQPEEGIVYDSATLRLSVKDKIKRLSKAPATTENPPGASDSSSMSGAPVAARTKAMSLPKNARLPGMPENDSDN